MPRLAILGASGKLAFATLTALHKHNLIPTESIIATTSAIDSSSPQHAKLSSITGVEIRYATFDEPASIEKALQGAEKLLLVSSPRINKDFHDAAPGTGREADHIAAIDAAVRAGAKHIYYTSLGFGSPSKAGVMRAHIRTEEYLATKLPSAVQYTVIREGLYNESWPLYFGHWELGKDDRNEVLVAGDSKISWTSIPDLGLGTALILAADSAKYAGKTFYLSNAEEGPRSLADLAGKLSQKLSREIKVKVVSRKEHEDFYIQQRGMDAGFIEWWSTTYDALRDEECLIKDDTLKGLLDSVGAKAKPMDETVAEMLQ